jgi:HEAT repeat protein
MLKDESQSWETRWFAARSLGHFDRPTVVTALIDALGTADEDLQEAILEALSQIGPSAIAALSTLVADPTYQPVALAALTRIPHPDTQAPLVAAVDLVTGATKAQVIEALGQFADLNLLPIFTEAVQDWASSVRLAALQGLICLRTQVNESCWVVWIQPLVRDVNPAVAQRAIHALGRTSDLAATQILQGLLAATHAPEVLKIAAVQALAWQGTAAALAVVIHRWDVLSDDVRIALVQGLSQITSSSLKAQMIHPVQQWLSALPATADHSWLRRNLVMLLGQVGGDAAIPLLQDLSQDADRGVRFHAEAALRTAP